ncbi:TPA: lectin-like domain-containing protein, partial [Enterococcus faecalis]
MGTLIMVVGQNIAGVTAFAETISNQESVIEDIYFEKNNTKISEITLEQGKEETITFVDENKEDEEAIVTLPESTKLNLAETNSQLDDASTVNYDQDTNQVKITFKNKEQNIKRTNLILATNDTVENNQARMYAQVVRLDSQTYMSKPVIITTTSSENNKQQEETQKNEEDGESAQQSSTNGESSNSLETNSLNKEQKNEVENTSNVDSTESTSVEKELQDKEESINKNEESTNRIKREINSAKATGDFSVAPPASNIKITEQFTNNLSGNSNSYISETYPQAAALTPKESWQFGSIWSNYQLDLTKSFEYKSHVYLGERTGSDFNDTTAADGITFTLQNDPRGQGAYGTEGGGLGAYGSGGSVEKPQDYNYIQNALSVELDTWYNGSDRKNDQFDKDIPTEAKNSGHIGIVRPGPGEPGQSKIGHLQYKYDVNSPLADNTWKEFNIIWTPIVENGILKANITYSLGNMSNTYHIEDVKSMFNGTKTYFGFTSSTGQNKIFQGVSIDSLPQRGFVYVNYKDIDTKENIDSEKELSGNLSNKWISEKKDFTNLDYQYVRVDGATSGEFTQDTQYVTYWYRKLLPKIEIKKSVDKETAKVGDELTYTITAKNSGEGNWNGTITDKIPTEYVNLVSGTTTVNGEKVEDNDVWKDNVLNVKQTIKAG